MLEGAILGGIVGFIVAFMAGRKRLGAARRVNEAFRASGIDGARALLDDWIPPVSGEVAVSKLLNVMERLAALGVMGDLETLERELKSVSGALTVSVQLKTIGTVGLLLGSEDRQRWVTDIEALATKVESEGGRMLTLVKRTTRFIARVGGELVGRGACDLEARTRLANYAQKMGPFTKILLLRLLVESAQVTDRPVDELRARLHKAERFV